MGLDVYLYRYGRPVAEVQAWESAIEAAADAAGDEFMRTHDVNPDDDSSFSKIQARGLTDAYFDAKKEARRKFRNDGIDDDDPPVAMREQVEIDSAKYPKHMFKVGYFRSSYNESGLNRILRERLGTDLGDIFPGDDYVRAVDWTAARDRASIMLAKWDEHFKATGDYTVLKFFPNPFIGPDDYVRTMDSPQKAMAAFQDVLKSHPEPAKDRFIGDSFSTRGGDFFLHNDAIEVVAVFSGVENVSFAKALYGRDLPLMGCYVIARCKPTRDEESGEMLKPFEWHRRAIEIVVETCDWVLAQKDPSQYLLHWSG